MATDNGSTLAKMHRKMSLCPRDTYGYGKKVRNERYEAGAKYAGRLESWKPHTNGVAIDGAPPGRSCNKFRLTFKWHSRIVVLTLSDACFHEQNPTGTLIIQN